MPPSEQAMDLIDILWRQDIDLGARREVFDYSYRQKESELQRQRELQEEKRLQTLREQEKALLAQLQLDEETGEFVPRPASGGPPQSAAPSEATQNASFPGDAMSFDECMQLLAETFPLVEESETTSACLDAAVVPAPNSGRMMIAPAEAALPLAPLFTPPLAPQSTSPDLEQAWMELLSLPELQQCLNMQMQDTLETTAYLPNSSPGVEGLNYSFYPLPNLADVGSNTPEVRPSEFINTFQGTFQNMAPPDHLSQMTLKPPELDPNFGADSFCNVFYPDLHNTKVGSDVQPQSGRGSVFKPVDTKTLSSRDPLERGKPEAVPELPDSDSGVSFHTSPNDSPEKSQYGDGSYGYSDSDMEEMDSNPGSAESDYSEMFSLNFQPDGLPPPVPVAGLTVLKQEEKPMPHKTEPDDDTGHRSHPFTKDKQKKHSEKRLSRDEQRAKTLRIPFTVDMVINMPVDDFNEMMSKHQLNEAQLALVRDIRRRGKNKVAAQNCRKRKMENIVGLEYDLDSLKEEKERQLKEKSQNASSLQDMKQQLHSLYLEVFSQLRDEEGKPYSPSEYSLQQTTDGSVFLVPRIKKTLKSNDD